MTTNVGTIDRGIRVIAGLALLAWAFGLIPNVGASPWGWVGIVPLFTGLFGTCPLYTMLGMNTCKRV